LTAYIKLLSPYRVSLAKQITETIVQVLAAREPKVVDEVAAEQRIDSVNQGMSSWSFEPDMPAQVAVARCDRYEPAPRLKDNPGLLCIYVNRPKATHSQDQGLKELANLRALVLEVFINSVVTTGMRHVARDKPLSARGTLPEWPLILLERSITHCRFQARITPVDPCAMRGLVLSFVL